MAPDTAVIDSEAASLIAEGENSYGNPFTFRYTNNSIVYDITTPNRRREVEILLNGTPRIIVTRYSREGRVIKSRKFGFKPSDFTDMDSFSLYWGRDSPMTIDEAIDHYGKPGEERYNISSLSDEVMTWGEVEVIMQVLATIEQDRHWDHCFIGELKEMLSWYGVNVEWRGKNTSSTSQQ